MSEIVSKRILTRKSLIGFGERKLLTVQQVLDIKRHIELVNMYYGLGKIDFTTDILDEIGIKEHMRIQKPSKGREYDLYKSHLPDILAFYKENTSDQEQALIRKFAAQNVRQEKANVLIRNKSEMSKAKNRNRHQR